MLMASSKVIASRSPPNSDLPRESTTSSLNINSDQAIRGFGSMNMDEIFRNMYPDSASFDSGGGEAAATGGSSAADAGDGGVRNGIGNGNKTVEEMWREIASGGGGSGEEPAMTLEDFLAKAGAVSEEDVRDPAVATITPPPPPTVGGFGMEAVMMSPAPGVPAVRYASAGCVQNVIGVDFGSGSGVGGGRGKRRVAVEEVPPDKATQQKQRRMIKNRESAARSRERKQAYTVELESLVTQLEEENALFLREEARLQRERHKQLMENIIPVVEKRRPPRVLRSTRSL